MTAAVYLALWLGGGLRVYIMDIVVHPEAVPSTLVEVGHARAVDHKVEETSKV